MRFVHRSAFLAVAAVAFSACATQRGMSADEPATLAARPGASGVPSMPAGASIVLQRTADLDGDGTDDLLVIHSLQADKTSPRALSIYLRDASGQVKLAVTNPTAVLCEQCGGMFGDPLAAVDVRKGGFTLRFEGGSREMWAQEFAFRYDRSASTWTLIEATASSLDRLDGSSATTANRTDTVRIDDFDPQRFMSN